MQIIENIKSVKMLGFKCKVALPYIPPQNLLFGDIDNGLKPRVKMSGL